MIPSTTSQTSSALKAPVIILSETDNTKITITRAAVDTFFRSEENELSIETRAGFCGKISLYRFLGSLLDAFSNSEFGMPTRFDLVGGAAASLASPGETLQDIDLAIEFPEEVTPKLDKLADFIKMRLHQEGIKGDPFFRKSLIPPTDDFKAVILSFGQEGKFWVDLTISTVKRRLFLFRRDAVRLSLLPYLKNKENTTLESTCGTLETVLEDRKQKRIVVPDAEKINHFGWPTLLLLISKAHTLETESAFATLQTTCLAFVKNVGKFGVLELLKKAFSNHGNQDSLKPSYYLTAFLSLLGKVTEDELQLVAKEGSGNKSKESQFLRIAASGCKNKKWRPHLSQIAFLLGLTKWPKPTIDEWEYFLLHLSDLDQFQKELIKLLSGNSLKDYFLEALLEGTIGDSESRKRLFRLFFEKCSPDERKHWIPHCIDYFLTQDPPFAAELGRRHSDYLSLEKKIAVTRALDGIPLCQYLDAMRKGADFNTFYSRISSLKTDALFVEYLVGGAASLQEIFSTLTWIRKINLPLDKTMAKLLFGAILKWKESAEKELLLTSFIFLIPHLEGREQEEALFTLYPLLKEPLLKKVAPSDKKALERLWPSLWLLLPNEKKNSLIEVLKKAKCSLILGKGEFLPLKAKYPPDDLALSTLLQNCSCEEFMRIDLVAARIVILEKEKRFTESEKLFLRNKELLQKEGYYQRLFDETHPSSPTRRQIAILLPTLTHPLLENFAHLSLEAKEIDLLYHFVRRALTHNLDPEKFLSLFFSCPEENERKATLLSDFPLYITQERVEKIHLKNLNPLLATPLFSALLDKEGLPYIVKALKQLSKKIGKELLWSALPTILQKINSLHQANQEEEFYFWFSTFPPIKWVEIPKKEAPLLCSFIEKDKRLALVILSLHIASATPATLSLALTSLLALSGSDFLHITCHFIERTPKACAFDLQNITTFFLKILEELNHFEGNKKGVLIARLKKNLLTKKCPQYLRFYVYIATLSPEGENGILDDEPTLTNVLEILYQNAQSVGELQFLETPIGEKCVSHFFKNRQKEINSWSTLGIPLTGCEKALEALFISARDEKTRLQAIDFCFNAVHQSFKNEKCSPSDWKRFRKALLSDYTFGSPDFDMPLFIKKVTEERTNPYLLIATLEKFIAGWIKMRPFLIESVQLHEMELLLLFKPYISSPLARPRIEQNPTLTLEVGKCLLRRASSDPMEIDLLGAIVSQFLTSPLLLDPALHPSVPSFLGNFIFRTILPGHPEVAKHHLGKIVEVVDSFLFAKISCTNIQTSLSTYWLARIPMRFPNGFALMKNLIPKEMGRDEAAKIMLASLEQVFEYLESVEAESFTSLGLEILEYLFKNKEPITDSSLLEAVKKIGDITLRNNNLEKKGSLFVTFEKILWQGIAERLQDKVSGGEETLQGLISLYGNFFIDCYDENILTAEEVASYFRKAIAAGFYSTPRNTLFYFHMREFSTLVIKKIEKSRLCQDDPIGELCFDFLKMATTTENEEKMLQYWVRNLLAKMDQYSRGVELIPLEDAAWHLMAEYHRKTQEQSTIDGTFFENYLAAHPKVRKIFIPEVQKT